MNRSDKETTETTEFHIKKHCYDEAKMILKNTSSHVNIEDILIEASKLYEWYKKQ